MFRTAKHLAASVAMAAAATAVTLPQAHAADFSKEECATIYGVARNVIKTVGMEKHSVQFRQSLVNFFGPTNTCDGPKDIFTPTLDDAATLKTIAVILAGGSKPIDIHAAGLRSVDPAKISAERPQEEKRTELSGQPALN